MENIEEPEGKTEKEAVEELNREAWFEEFKEAVINLGAEGSGRKLTKMIK